MPRKRKGLYSPWTKVAALAELERSGHSYYQTEKKTGIPRATLRRWERQRQRAETQPVEEGAIPSEDDETLDDQFEDVAYQLVAALPEKLEEANLHQLIEALKFVLDRVGQAEDDEGAGVYEKLAHLINRYAAPGAADGDPQPPDES